MLRKFFTLLPTFKGKYRIARAVFKKAVQQANNIVVDGRFGVRYKLPNLKENIGFEIFVDGIYEPGYIQYFQQRIPKNGVFLDLGANIGSICIPLARLRPDIRIIAVEASPRVFGYLKDNVVMNGCKNIIVENLALSSQDNIDLPFYSPEEKFGKGSLSTVFTDKAELVKTITVDTLKRKYHLTHVDYIKIDVEGYEKSVFEGGRELLSNGRAPVILFEFADWAENAGKGTKAGDAQLFLSELGYKLFDFTNPDHLGAEMKPQTSGNLMILAVK